MVDNLRHRTTMAFLWSMAQSWLVRLFSLVVFVVVARLLSPADLGLAQAVMLLLAFLAMIGEFGFHTALVQAPELEGADVNLPFYVSTGIGILGALILFFFASPVAHLMGEPRAAGLLRLAAVVPPLTASTGIAVALFRRDLDFASSAYANLAASVAAGSLAISMAWAGAGPLALVAQAICAGVVTALVVWWRSRWRPGIQLRTVHFRRLLSFSSFSYASAMIEYFATRVLDFIILSRFGLPVLGIYTVGAKLYLVLMELMAAALTDVATSMLAKIRGQQERVRRAYLRLIFIGNGATCAVLVMTAALSFEICELLFGAKWQGAAEVTQVLCVLGGLQAVQLFNTAILLSHGKSRAVFGINAARLLAAALILGLFPAGDVVRLAWTFAVSQALLSPLSFGMAMRIADVRSDEVLKELWPAWLGATLAFLAVHLTRSELSGLPLVAKLIALGSIFVSSYALSLLALRGRRLRAEWDDIVSGRRSEYVQQHAAERSLPAQLPDVWVVTDQLPYPPRNGVTLPSYHHATGLQGQARVRLVLLVDQDYGLDPNELAANEAIFGPVLQLMLKRRGRLTRLTDELLGREMYQHGFEGVRRQLVPLARSDHLLVTPFSAVAKLRAADPDCPIRCAGAFALVSDCTAGEYYFRSQNGSGNWRERLKGRLDRWRSGRIGLIERKLLGPYRAVLLQTRRDTEIFARLVGGEPAQRTFVLPNGVKEELFTQSRDCRPKGGCVVFLAELSGEYGGIARWLVHEVWPRVQEPDLELLIVGRGASEELRQLMASSPGVRYEAFVPKLESVYERATLAVSPVFKGFGLINKTLEAMAAGIPVVGGAAAFNGVEGFVSGVHGETCSQPDAAEFAAAIARLARDPDLSRQIGFAGRALIASGFRWNDANAKLRALMMTSRSDEEKSS